MATLNNVNVNMKRKLFKIILIYVNLDSFLANVITCVLLLTYLPEVDYYMKNEELSWVWANLDSWDMININFDLYKFSRHWYIFNIKAGGIEVYINKT
jgi:hypothetical protein